MNSFEESNFDCAKRLNMRGGKRDVDCGQSGPEKTAIRTVAVRPTRGDETAGKCRSLSAEKPVAILSTTVIYPTNRCPEPVNSESARESGHYLHESALPRRGPGERLLCRNRVIVDP